MPFGLTSGVHSNNNKKGFFGPMAVRCGAPVLTNPPEPEALPIFMMPQPQVRPKKVPIPGAKLLKQFARENEKQREKTKRPTRPKKINKHDMKRINKYLTTIMNDLSV